MANWSDPQPAATFGTAGASRGAAVDAGLRSHMLSVYNYMTSAVLLTGIVAMLFSWGGRDSYAYWLATEGGILRWVVMFAPLIMVLGLSFGANRMSAATMQIVYWVYAVAMGLSLSTIFLVYDLGSIATAFFASAAAFAGLSLYGYTTKRDLSAFGTFLIMGVVGLLVASLLNLFVQSSMLSFVISAVGVLLFAGLTAYDTQKIKSIYFEVAGQGELVAKSAILGALNLYLDFINMFLFILRLFGGNRY